MALVLQVLVVLEVRVDWQLAQRQGARGIMTMTSTGAAWEEMEVPEVMVEVVVMGQ